MESANKSITAKNMNEYLEGLPESVATVLGKLRKTIKSFAPKAEEGISYRIPVFKYNGPLVAFAAFKNHCSFFVMSTSVMTAFKEEIKSYDTAPGTIHFALDKPLPVSLVKKLVIARIKENEAILLARENKKIAARRSSKGQKRRT